MKKYAVFDIDGTLIRWQLYHAVANELAKEGLLGKDGLKKLEQARKKWKEREHDNAYKEYESKLVKIFEEYITSIPVAKFEQAVLKVISKYKNQTYKYTRDLLIRLKKEGYLLFAISGSQQEIIAHIAKEYGFDDYIGSSYHHNEGKFSGKKDIVALDKHTALEKLIKKHNATPQGSIGVGDTASDIPLFKLVEQPIVFNPEKELFIVASKNHWKIVIERKNVLYTLEYKDGRYVLA